MHVCIFVSVQTTERILPQCGDKLFYYPESQICCENEVYEMKTGHEVCCGWKVYDGSAEHCCFGMIIYLEEKCKGPFHRQPFETTATPDNEV